MSTLDKIQKTISGATQTVASLVKVPLMSGRPSPSGRGGKGTVIIMGNGPSLNEAMSLHREVLERMPKLAVNRAVATPDFFALKPEYYLLADGVFFSDDRSGKVRQMWETFGRVDWPMTLFIPARYRKFPELRHLPAGITVKRFNLTPAEGWKRVTHWLFRHGLAMPRPRNVLVPSIMCMMREGFSRIVLTGADHNWSQTLWVTDRNRVVTVQPHFYRDDDDELQRVEELYKDIHIHQLYQSFAIAFKSYFDVQDYASSRGVSILNATPGSFIDAFPRISLDTLA